MSISQRTTKLILATCLACLLIFSIFRQQFRLELSLS